MSSSYVCVCVRDCGSFSHKWISIHTHSQWASSSTHKNHLLCPSQALLSASQTGGCCFAQGGLLLGLSKLGAGLPSLVARLPPQTDAPFRFSSNNFTKKNLHLFFSSSSFPFVEAAAKCQQQQQQQQVTVKTKLGTTNQHQGICDFGYFRQFLVSHKSASRSRSSYLWRRSFIISG